MITDLFRSIGAHVSSLIEDGSVLQLGIGGIPDAVLPNLMDRKDLGVHTELISDNAIPLIESGVINGQRKNFKPRKIILGFMLGTKKLFDFVDENPIFEFHPSAYTNDPFRISQNERMVAINSAIEVDLTGQVCAESIGTWFYSGFGGQLDFIRGAARSKGGKPIIALPATAKERHGVAHRASAGPWRGRPDRPRRCALRGHRIRCRVPARKDHPAAGRGPDPDRPPQVPHELDGILRETALVSA